MPTALDKAETCRVMGWTHEYADHYKGFRNEMEQHIIKNDIKGPLAVGKNNWATFMNHAAQSKYFIMKAKYTNGDEVVKRRLDLLLQDVCKQWCAKLNRHKRKYDATPAAPAARADDGKAEADERPTKTQRRSAAAFTKAVKIYIVNPIVDPNGGAAGHPKAGGKYEWIGHPFIGTLYDSTMAEVWNLVAKYCPPGTHAREIWGAMTDPHADATNFPSEQQCLGDSNQVEAFFLMTTANPIYLLAVLSTSELVPPRPNTPANPIHPYLIESTFAPPEPYDEPDSDSEAVISRHADLRSKRLPRKDAAFEERLREMRIRIRKWKEAKAVVKRKHKALHPAAIHSDDEGEYFFMHFPADGSGVANDVDAFIARRPQAIIDEAADSANGNGPPYIPVGLPNPRVDGPQWEYPDFV